MNILYFTQFYAPEATAGAFRAFENAKYWSRNNKVTIFTGYPNYPTGKIFDGYTPKLISKEEKDNVIVIRNKLIVKPNTNIIKRLENVLSYYFFGKINTFFNSKKIGKDYDVVIGSSGPIFNAMLAQKYARKIKAAFVFEIRDITFVQMQATGKSAKSLGVRLMKHLELKMCRKASRVVVVTNGFKKILSEEGISEDKISVITNGVDVAENAGAYDNKEKTVLSYFGTLGISQNVKETFEYAEIISKLVKDFEYLIIGEGAQKKIINEAASSIPYIRVLPGMPPDELEAYYNDTQLSVIKLRKTSNFKYTIPSKLFQVMGKGIAVLFIGPDGETAGIIRDNNAGIVLTGSIEEDTKVLVEFFNNDNWKEKLREMGANGRRIVVENYSRQDLADCYLNLLDALRTNN